ncbi:hypothetical protein BYT27DRAFT_7122654 [Phlegmacium glaucopus]|nr:hypothetical protein BYT27DRAFT_7122654 [Phlegmacium glaucopus]
MIEIPQGIICPDYSINSLVEEVYPGIEDGEKSDQLCILACKNDSVQDLNEEILNRFPGEEH